MQKAIECHCEPILKGQIFSSSLVLFTSVSSAFAYVTRFSSMGLRPAIAQKSDMGLNIQGQRMQISRRTDNNSLLFNCMKTSGPAFSSYRCKMLLVAFYTINRTFKGRMALNEPVDECCN